MDIEYDEDGWTSIHHCVAAEKELLMSIEKFITSNEEYLEVETKDSLQRTPLLLAIERNKPKSVEKLIDLGARITALDSHNHGIVEICAMTENLEMLHHFIELNYPELNVWQRLIKFLSAHTDKEAEKAAQILERLTRENNECKCDKAHWEPLLQYDGIPAIIKVCKSSCSDSIKVMNTALINNVIHHSVVPPVFAKAGGIKVIVSLVNRWLKAVYPYAFNILREVTFASEEIASQVNDSGFLQIATKIINKPDKITPEVMTNLILTIRNIARASEKMQKAVGDTPGMFEALHSLFEHPEYQTNVELLSALTKAVSTIVACSTDHQNLCVDTEGITPLIMVSRASKFRDLQTSAINALYRLSLNNNYTTKKILDEGAVSPLMQILKKSRALPLQEAISLTLWSLAGTDINEKRSMASMMGVNMLIEFLGAAGECADNLNYIGAEGLGVLAQGAHNKQIEIAEAGGIQPLIRQLRSSSSSVVTSVIQSLRHLCIGIGYVTNSKNQDTIAQSRGLKFLVALMAHSKAELIKVESAITLGAIALGNQENTASLDDNPDFSFLHMIRLLYSNNDAVRSLAGTALALFSFNSVLQQKKIADCGGVRWENFFEFLSSKDDKVAINAAFQVVVLSRIIPDKEPAISSAEGIKTLIHRLETTDDDGCKGLAADCIARLAHTRAGVPSAMVSINVVSLLCKLLNLRNDQVRGSAAVALGYLSFDHAAEREMLRICREEPHLIHAINYYTKNYKLSPMFLEGWKHCLHVGLPKKAPSKATTAEFVQGLTQNISSSFIKQPKELSSSFQTLTEEANALRAHSHHQSSRASQLLASLHDDMSQLHGRSTHSSRLTRNSRNTLKGAQHHFSSKQSISSPMSQDPGPSISQQSQASSVVVAHNE